jgi:hypothetical protein
MKFVKPEYEVHSTVWIASQTPQEPGGPIRSRELLNPNAWVDLFRSYRISDAVVRKLALYVKPSKADDSPLFADFSISDRFLPGDYTLTVDSAARVGISASRTRSSTDSWRRSAIRCRSRVLGCAGQPEREVAEGGAGRDVKFSGVDAAAEVSQESEPASPRRCSR